METEPPLELEELPEKAPPPLPETNVESEPPRLIADFGVPLPAAAPVVGPVGPDPFAEQQRGLLQHRLKADESVRRLHLGHARAIHLEVLAWTSSLGSACAWVITGPWVGLAWLVLALLSLSSRVRLRFPLRVIAGIWLLAAIGTGILSLLLSGSDGIPLGPEVAVWLGIGFLASLPFLHRWAITPLPDPTTADGLAATGDPGRQRLSTQPEQLSAQHDHQIAVTALNDRILGLRSRLTTARLAVAGATGGVLGCALAGFGSTTSGRFTYGFGATTGLGLVCVGIVTGIAGGWIGWRRLGPTAALAIYGPTACFSYLLAMAAGLAGFQVLISFWVMVGWLVIGGVLGLLAELAEDTAPQRTT